MKGNKKLIDSPIYKLFTRFLKDNNLQVNIDCFTNIFIEREIILVHMLITYYIQGFIENNRSKYDELNRDRNSWKLKWITVLVQNYAKIVREEEICYLSLDNVTNINFKVLSLFALQLRLKNLKEFI